MPKYFIILKWRKAVTNKREAGLMADVYTVVVVTD